MDTVTCLPCVRGGGTAYAVTEGLSVFLPPHRVGRSFPAARRQRNTPHAAAGGIPRARRRVPHLPPGRFASPCPGGGENRGEAADGKHHAAPRRGGRDGRRGPSFGGPGWGPRQLGREKGRGDAHRQARAAHPRRAAHSQPRAAPSTPVRWRGLPGPRFSGGPRTGRHRPGTARPHTHQATPTPHATTRPTPGRDKPHDSHKGRGSLAQSASAVCASLTRPGRIPFKSRPPCRDKRPRTGPGPQGTARAGAAKIRGSAATGRRAPGAPPQGHPRRAATGRRPPVHHLSSRPRTWTRTSRRRRVYGFIPHSTQISTRAAYSSFRSLVETVRRCCLSHFSCRFRAIFRCFCNALDSTASTCTAPDAPEKPAFSTFSTPFRTGIPHAPRKKGAAAPSISRPTDTKLPLVRRSSRPHTGCIPTP